MEFEDLVDKWQLGKKYVFAAERLKTFNKLWTFKDDSPCNAIKVAEAGFYNTSSPESFHAAKCAFCSKELEFDETDNPWEEHRKRGEKCEFVQLNKLDERTWTVKDYLLLLAAAHTQVVLAKMTDDYKNLVAAGDEIRKMIAAISNNKE